MDLSNVETKDIFIMAFRYCLGRSTYVVADMVSLIDRNWNNFSREEKYMIKHEIKYAIKVGQAGMDMDVKSWQEILELED